MAEVIIFVFGVFIGVIYEKKIRRLKDAASKAAQAAKAEMHK